MLFTLAKKERKKRKERKKEREKERERKGKEYSGTNLTKYLYEEKYKTLIKESKEELNKWRYIPCS